MDRSPPSSLPPALKTSSKTGKSSISKLSRIRSMRGSRSPPVMFTLSRGQEPAPDHQSSKHAAYLRDVTLIFVEFIRNDNMYTIVHLSGMDGREEGGLWKENEWNVIRRKVWRGMEKEAGDEKERSRRIRRNGNHIYISLSVSTIKRSEHSNSHLFDDVRDEVRCAVAGLLGNVHDFLVRHLDGGVGVEVGDVGDEREAEHLDSELTGNCDFVAGRHAESVGADGFEQGDLEVGGWRWPRLDSGSHLSRRLVLWSSRHHVDSLIKRHVSPTSHIYRQLPQSLIISVMHRHEASSESGIIAADQRAETC